MSRPLRYQALQVRMWSAGVWRRFRRLEGIDGCVAGPVGACETTVAGDRDADRRGRAGRGTIVTRGTCVHLGDQAPAAGHPRPLLPAHLLDVVQRRLWPEQLEHRGWRAPGLRRRARGAVDLVQLAAAGVAAS